MDSPAPMKIEPPFEPCPVDKCIRRRGHESSHYRSNIRGKRARLAREEAASTLQSLPIATPPPLEVASDRGDAKGIQHPGMAIHLVGSVTDNDSASSEIIRDLRAASENDLIIQIRLLELDLDMTRQRIETRLSELQNDSLLGQLYARRKSVKQHLRALTAKYHELHHNDPMPPELEPRLVVDPDPSAVTPVDAATAPAHVPATAS